MFLKEEAGVILGYEGEKLLFRPYGFKGERWDLLADDQWDWASAAVLGERSCPPPRAESLIKSLKLAVELSKAPPAQEISRIRTYTLVCGIAAYEAWIAQLPESKRFERDDEERYGGTVLGNAWTLEVLVDARATAARYLKSIAGELPGARDHLVKAAEFYEKESATLKPAMRLAPYPWQSEQWTAEMRREQSRILSDALTLEKQALAEISAALKSL
jgi:hypothetical protein